MREGRFYMRGRRLYTEGSLSPKILGELKWGRAGYTWEGGAYTQREVCLGFWVSLNERGKVIHEKKGLIHREVCLGFWVSLNEGGQVIHERKGLIHRGSLSPKVLGELKWGSWQVLHERKGLTMSTDGSLCTAGWLTYLVLCFGPIFNSFLLNTNKKFLTKHWDNTLEQETDC